MTVFLEFLASMQNQNNSQQTFTSSKLRRSGVFIVNNKHTSHIFLVFLVYLMLPLKLMLTSSRISIVDYEQINVSWVSGQKTLPNFFMSFCNNVCNYCISIFLTKLMFTKKTSSLLLARHASNFVCVLAVIII